MPAEGSNPKPLRHIQEGGVMRFRTTIVQGDKTATGIRVPDDVIAALGPSRRPPVQVTVNGYTYRTTVAVLNGTFMFGVSADVRKNAGVAGGARWTSRSFSIPNRGK